MKNILISDKLRDEYLRNTGKKFDEHRHSGRTTGLALYFIGLAMINPGQWIDVCNHSEGNTSYVCKLMRFIIDELQLKGFECKLNKVNYNIFNEEV